MESSKSLLVLTYILGDRVSCYEYLTGIEHLFCMKITANYFVLSHSGSYSGNCHTQKGSSVPSLVLSHKEGPADQVSVMGTKAWACAVMSAGRITASFVLIKSAILAGSFALGGGTWEVMAESLLGVALEEGRKLRSRFPIMCNPEPDPLISREDS